MGATHGSRATRELRQDEAGLGELVLLLLDRDKLERCQGKPVLQRRAQHGLREAPESTALLTSER